MKNLGMEAFNVDDLGDLFFFHFVSASVSIHAATLSFKLFFYYSFHSSRHIHFSPFTVLLCFSPFIFILRFSPFTALLCVLASSFHFVFSYLFSLLIFSVHSFSSHSLFSFLSFRPLFSFPFFSFSFSFSSFT